MTTAPFSTWYRSAGVRSGARRRFDEERDQGKVFFPGHLVPYLEHELVAPLPPPRLRELTVRHLYQFLIATTHLETGVVNLAAERIATGRSGVDVSMEMRLDAFKIYCDEGYHALYSLDLADQIAAWTAIGIPRIGYDRFLVRLRDTGRRLLPDHPVLADLLQAVVFETLITSVLNELPADGSVMTTVRDVMRDHARDEGRHHRYFSSFLHLLWTELDRPTRTLAAQALPPLIRECLRWDDGPVRGSLRLAGLTRDEADQVVHDVYGSAPAVRQVTRATVKACESAGVLDVPGGREAFAAHGLLGTEQE